MPQHSNAQYDASPARFEYDLEAHRVRHGYTDRTLWIDLGSNSIESRVANEQMKELFVGGKGYALYLLWNALPLDREIQWDDPANELCVSAGPIAGVTNYPGTGKSIAVTVSPLTGSVIDSNAGGYFGPYLKFAGFDALELCGKASEETLVIIDGVEGEVRLVEAADLPTASYPLVDHLHAQYGAGNPRSIAVVSAGPGAENALFGCLNFSWYDSSRKLVRMKQAGRGGTGTVLRDKRIKALVVRAPPVRIDSINAAHPDRLRTLGKAAIHEVSRLDPVQKQMAIYGTTGGVSALNEFDILPVRNYREGRDDRVENIEGEVFKERFDPGFDGCWFGCAVSCSHGVAGFELKTGPDRGKRVYVDGPEYETIAACGSNCGIFDPDHIIEMNYYCDNYGLDTISVGTSTAFVMECYELGILDEEDTGGLELSFGNADAALKLLHQIATGSGFGAMVGQGIRRMKAMFYERFDAPRALLDDIGMESKGLEYSEFVTKEAWTQAAGYALALKGAQHDEMSVAFPDAVKNTWPSIASKAEALYWLPLWRTWFSLCGLCKLPWNTVIPPENEGTQEPWKVMPHVENYAALFTAVTGHEVTPEDLLTMSERVYTLQRLFALRLGYGRRKDDHAPYRSIGPALGLEYRLREERYDRDLEERFGIDPTEKTLEEKLALLRTHRRAAFEKLVDAVYQRRGWTTNGVPTLAKLRELELDGLSTLVDLAAADQ